TDGYRRADSRTERGRLRPMPLGFHTSSRRDERDTFGDLFKSSNLVCCNRDIFTKASSPPPSPPEEEREKLFGRIVKLLLLHNTMEKIPYPFCQAKSAIAGARSLIQGRNRV